MCIVCRFFIKEESSSSQARSSPPRHTKKNPHECCLHWRFCTDSGRKRKDWPVMAGDWLDSQARCFPPCWPVDVNLVICLWESKSIYQNVLLQVKVLTTLSSFFWSSFCIFFFVLLFTGEFQSIQTKAGCDLAIFGNTNPPQMDFHIAGFYFQQVIAVM